MIEHGRAASDPEPRERVSPSNPYERAQHTDGILPGFDAPDGQEHWARGGAELASKGRDSFRVHAGEALERDSVRHAARAHAERIEDILPCRVADGKAKASVANRTLLTAREVRVLEGLDVMHGASNGSDRSVTGTGRAAREAVEQSVRREAVLGMVHVVAHVLSAEKIHELGGALAHERGGRGRRRSRGYQAQLGA